MGVKKVLKAATVGGLNPKRWLGLGQLKSQSKTVTSLVKDTFKSQKEGDGYQPTSFEDCMQHYDLTEAGLQKKMKTSQYMTYFCLGLSVLTFLYMFYQFLHTSLLGGLMCLVLTFVLWALAFREHFNLYQMRERRLGCSVKEWFHSLFRKSH